MGSCDWSISMVETERSVQIFVNSVAVRTVRKRCELPAHANRVVRIAPNTGQSHNRGSVGYSAREINHEFRADWERDWAG